MNNTDPLKNIRVVLTQPSHPGNIGAAARAMKTMGLNALCLVNPRQFPHPDADARAAGALDVLQHAQVCDSLAAALSGCVLAVATSSRQRELRHEMMTAREAARELLAQAASHPVAIVFGNETSGLSSEEASLCQVWACIPANPEYASLNLAAAVQIFAYELRMARPDGQCRTRLNSRRPVSSKSSSCIGISSKPWYMPVFSIPPIRSACCRGCVGCSRARLETEEVNILRGFPEDPSTSGHADEIARLQRSAPGPTGTELSIVD